ncbi:uncharacterized protein LOC128387208 [Panonychus citri]|uniref:uncharacterized protein LOC128387208 n=1 Tax=Panonychus citri TaxID=50023 RepID=UPI002307F23D|nr:uncharacterized protein LOC128387208 [Panonychus citri]
MELTDLPYDCLSCIFDCIPDLKQLLDKSTVCKQWNILVKRRLKKIRHLHVVSEDFLPYFHFSSDNHIYTDDVELMERVDVSQLLPNLKFLSLSLYPGQKCTGKMLVNILSSTAKPLVGLTCKNQCCMSNDSLQSGHVDIEEIVKHCESLEYMNIWNQFFRDIYFFKYKFGQNLKYFDGCTLPWYNEDYDSMMEEINLLCCYAARMPNLEVLILKKPLNEPRLWCLPKMKLKEIKFQHISSGSPVFQFLPLFPDLRSIKLSILKVKNKDEGFPDSHTHLNVQDVVLKIHKHKGPTMGCFKHIKSILVKFPNCTNLYINLKNCEERKLLLTKEHFIEMIKILPNLTLIVLNSKNCGDANTIGTLDKFCKSTGRRINFILRGDDRANDGTRVRSCTRFALNEDVASPLKIDNEFLQKYVY